MSGRVFIFLILIFIPLVSPAENAGDTISVMPQLKKELSEKVTRVPEKEFFNPYLSAKEYRYGDDGKLPVKDNFLKRIGKKFIELWKTVLNAFRLLPLLLRIASLVLCLVLVFYIILRTKPYKVFYTDSALPPPEFVETDITGEEMNITEAIRAEVSKQNFRNAIRLLHIKLLRDLEAHDIIKLSGNKTNKDYAAEIADRSLNGAFIELSGIYNRVWYGNINLSSEEYNSMSLGFYRFSARINAQEE